MAPAPRDNPAKQSGGSQTKACELLRITRGALQYKLKKFHIGGDADEDKAA